MPVTEAVTGAEPVAKIAGDICVIVGVGLSTSRFTTGPDPLVDAPLSAITVSVPP